VSEKYEFIDAEYAAHPADREPAHAPSIRQMCDWLSVSKSGFYAGSLQSRERVAELGF
jgi:hypothetical protein